MKKRMTKQEKKQHKQLRDARKAKRNGGGFSGV